METGERFTPDAMRPEKEFPSKCWGCGKEIILSYEPRYRVFCPECKEKHDKEHSEKLDVYLKLKGELMLERALRKLENQSTPMDEYLAPYKYIKDKIENREHDYKSSEEIMIALVLTNFGYDFMPNYSIGKYCVDFYIPELFTCLEVDGFTHDLHTIYDSRRDVELRKVLGAKWEIIRVKTEFIDKNPEKIIDAIEAMYAEKKQLRAQNNGIIPERFSERERDLYKRINTRKRLV